MKKTHLLHISTICSC